MKTKFFTTLLMSQVILGVSVTQAQEPISMTAPEVVDVQEQVFKSAPSVSEEVKFLNPEELTATDAELKAEPIAAAPATDVATEMFSLLDTDSNGVLSDTEIKEYVQKSAELDNLPAGQMAEKIVTALQLMDKYDADKDRTLNPAEAKEFFAEYNQVQ